MDPNPDTNKFIKKGITTFNDIGSEVLKELCNGNDGEINRDHMFLLLRNTNIINFKRDSRKENILIECIIKSQESVNSWFYTNENHILLD
jgi:hypothetical protein